MFLSRMTSPETAWNSLHFLMFSGKTPDTELSSFLQGEPAAHWKTTGIDSQRFQLLHSKVAQNRNNTVLHFFHLWTTTCSVHTTLLSVKPHSAMLLGCPEPQPPSGWDVYRWSCNQHIQLPGIFSICLSKQTSAFKYCDMISRDSETSLTSFLTSSSSSRVSAASCLALCSIRFTYLIGLDKASITSRNKASTSVPKPCCYGSSIQVLRKRQNSVFFLKMVFHCIAFKPTPV